MSGVRVKTSLTGLSVRTLGFYRHVRRMGFSRHDANMIILGVVSATGEGELDMTLPRPVAPNHEGGSE